MQEAARNLGVDPKSIREWCSQNDKFIALKIRGKSKRKRLNDAGRKAMEEDMEEALISCWIQDMHCRNLRVSRKLLCMWARELASSPDFKASIGWLSRSMVRKGLSLGRKTTVCQKTPADSIPELVTFVTHVRSLQIRVNYPSMRWTRHLAGWICLRILLLISPANARFHSSQQDMRKIITLSS